MSEWVAVLVGEWLGGWVRGWVGRWDLTQRNRKARLSGVRGECLKKYQDLQNIVMNAGSTAALNKTESRMTYGYVIHKGYACLQSPSKTSILKLCSAVNLKKQRSTVAVSHVESLSTICAFRQVTYNITKRH